jgi:hypothetical protein
MMKSLYKKTKLLIFNSQKLLHLKIILINKINQIKISKIKVNSFIKQKNKYKS